MIRIQKLFGPQAGLQTTHVEEVITFGRAVENTVSVEHEHLSRRHAELRRQDGQWYVVNQSANGTTVNRRAVSADQPHLLHPGDEIGVGKQPLIAVHFTPSEGSATVAAAPNAADQGRSADTTRRARNWALIAICGLSVLAMLFAVFSPGEREQGSDIPAQLTDEQIADEIRQRPQVTPDEREAARHLAEARQWYARTEAHDAGLYNAHRHYKLALGYSGRDTFDGVDQLQFQDLERKLIEDITARYRDAYAAARTRNWPIAEGQLRELQRTYPDADSAIWKNVAEQLDVVVANQPRRKVF